ncbi:MAG: hypothetical protein Ct9H90mP14_3480 [Methanobacteriota archaeon]|nr:MAG: hypothetical protein Ct9H90mP14_3480 [Euryarchaeota archaeon]
MECQKCETRVIVGTIPKQHTQRLGLKIFGSRSRWRSCGNYTLWVVSNDAERQEAISLADAEANLSVELDEEGVTIKADTVGGLEALAKELRAVEVPIRHASIGKVNRRDVRTAENSNDPLHRIILAFATEILPDAEEEIENSENGVKYLGSDIIYHILEEREEWVEQRTRELEEASREKVVYPGRILLLPDHTFPRLKTCSSRS